MNRPPFKRWQFLAREDIHDVVDGTAEVYLTRWRIVQTPWFAIYLHAIRRPDADRHLHDHPWPFVSLVLRGGYVEERPDGYRHWRAGSVHRMHAEGLHRIAVLARKPTWTLLLVGRRKRTWGFQTADGWMPYWAYFESMEQLTDDR